MLFDSTHFLLQFMQKHINIFINSKQGLKEFDKNMYGFPSLSKYVSNLTGIESTQFFLLIQLRFS